MEQNKTKKIVSDRDLARAAKEFMCGASEANDAFTDFITETFDLRPSEIQHMIDEEDF